MDDINLSVHLSTIGVASRGGVGVGVCVGGGGDRGGLAVCVCGGEGVISITLIVTL